MVVNALPSHWDMAAAADGTGRVGARGPPGRSTTNGTGGPDRRPFTSSHTRCTAQSMHISGGHATDRLRSGSAHWVAPAAPEVGHDTHFHPTSRTQPAHQPAALIRLAPLPKPLTLNRVPVPLPFLRSQDFSDFEDDEELRAAGVVGGMSDDGDVLDDDEADADGDGDDENGGRQGPGSGGADGPAGRRPATYDMDSMHSKLEDIGWADEVEWDETLAVTGEAATVVDNVEDDLGRELAFYNQVRRSLCYNTPYMYTGVSLSKAS